MNNDYAVVLSLKAKRIIFLFFIAVIVFCIYLVVSAIITVKTTGVLKVSAAQKATISINRTDSQAKTIGEPGKAQVRLKPGTYQVVATASNGEQAARVVSIVKKHSTTLSLTPTTAPKLHSVNSINFFGTSALTNIGVNSNQLSTIKLDFFRFNTSATAVNIDQKSVQTAPYILGNPTVVSFNASVDSQAYNAKLTYSDMDNIQLQLYNPQNGQLVYDSFAQAHVKNLD